MKNRTVVGGLLLVSAFTLGMVAALLGTAATRTVTEPLIVVCEQGTFEAVSDPGDPYLRETSDVCNLTNSEGRPVKVLVID